MPDDLIDKPQPKDPVNFRTLFKALGSNYKSWSFWRLILVLLFITFFALFGLGIGFYLIVFGLLMALIRIPTLYPPAGRFIGKLTGIRLFITRSTNPPLPVWRMIIHGLPILIYLGMAGIGIFILIKGGFLGQNFIYLLFFK